MAKLTFGATCAAGPALGVFRDQVIVCWPGGGGLGGAEPNYKLNLMPVFPHEASTDLDGLRVLDEWSAYRPALAEHGGKLFIAWTGNDPMGRVNIIAMPDLQAVPRPTPPMEPFPGRSTFVKETFEATAVGGPCLFNYDGELWLAFSGGGGVGGGEPNGKINIARVDASGAKIRLADLTVLEDQTSWHGPCFAPFVATSGPNAQLLMAWTGTNDHIYVHDCYERRFEQLDDHFYHQQGPPERSDTSPAMASFTSQPSDWSFIVLFRGTDPDHHLYETGGGGNNVGLASRTGWSDCSAFEPAIVHHPRFPGDSDWIYAWAGTDGVHRLNVALRSDLVDMHVPVDHWYEEAHV